MLREEYMNGRQEVLGEVARLVSTVSDDGFRKQGNQIVAVIALTGPQGNKLRRKIRTAAGKPDGDRTRILPTKGNHKPQVIKHEARFVDKDGKTVEKPDVKKIQSGEHILEEGKDYIDVGADFVCELLR